MDDKELEKPNYFSILPAAVRYDNNLSSTEKLLYSEITSLADKNGCCWATNNYFAKLFNIYPANVSRKINNLRRKGYIAIKLILKDGTKAIDKRLITPLLKTTIPIVENDNTPIVEIDKGNNTSINNIKEIYNNKLLYMKKKFKKPTLEEVKDYCFERKNSINPQSFIDHYETVGWVVGRNGLPMKDWKSAIRTWELNTKKQNKEDNKIERILG